MSVSQDFEARRKARLIRQRKQREKMRKIKFVASLVVFVLFIVFIATLISKCNKDSGTSQNLANSSVAVEPAETPPTEVRTISEIPEPKVGDNNLLDVVVDSKQKGHVYLTFDDGPSEGVTGDILDVLRKYNVKATFFMVGENIEENPGLCARVVDEGHLAAVHTYTHSYSTVYSDESTFMDEVQKTYELIVANSPGNKEPFKVFRFPGGTAGNSRYASIIEDCKEALARDGYYFCDWNCSNADNENTRRTADQLYSYFKNTRPNLNNLVIHMHDDDDNGETAKMLELLIPQLLDEGYIFSRLDEIDFSNADIIYREDDADEDEDETDTEDDNRDTNSTSANSSSANSSNRNSSSNNTNSSNSSNSSSRPSGTTSGNSSSSSSSSGRTSGSSSSSSSSNSNSSSGGSTSSGGNTSAGVPTSTNDIDEDDFVLDVQ